MHKSGEFCDLYFLTVHDLRLFRDSGSGSLLSLLHLVVFLDNATLFEFEAFQNRIKLCFQEFHSVMPGKCLHVVHLILMHLLQTAYAFFNIVHRHQLFFLFLVTFLLLLLCNGLFKLAFNFHRIILDLGCVKQLFLLHLELFEFAFDVIVDDILVYLLPEV